MSRHQHRENRVGDGHSQVGVVPDDNTTLRPTEGLASRPSHHGSPLREGILEKAGSH